MSDDLVAALTLKIINEMNAEIDDIRNGFGGLDETLTQLNEVLGALSEQLATLTMPATMAESLTAVTTEADAAAAAVNAIGAAAADAATSGQALRDAFAGYGGGGFSGGMTFMPPVPGYEDDGSMRPDFIPPETNIPWNGPEQPDPAEGGGHGGHSGDMATNLLFAGLEVMTGKDAAEKYADFDWILTHIAITEKLSGDAGDHEKQFLTGFLDNLATQTGTSSTDLADAYYFLVTTGMNRQLIQNLMPSLAETAVAYNVPVSDQVQGVLALNETMGIDPSNMGVALAMLADAGKVGHFSVADFSRYLPGLATQMKMMGDTGLSGEEQLAAALEAVRFATGTSEEDATDVNDLINYISSPIAARFFDRTQRSKDLLGAPILGLFQKYHVPDINIPAFLDHEKDEGIDSLDAMVDLARKIYNPAMTPTDEREIFGALFHNSEAARAAFGLVEYYDKYTTDEKTFKAVDPGIIHTDYESASKTPEIALREFDEQLSQTVRTIGFGLVPTFELLTVIVHDFGVGLQQVEKGFDIVTAPLATGLGTTAAYAAHEMDQYPNGAQRSRFGYNQPLTIHLKVDQSGTVTAATSPTPGVNVLASRQGRVLGVP